MKLKTLDVLCVQIAEKALATLQCLDRPSDVQSDPSWWRLIEEAKVYWTRNEKTTAMHLIKALLDKISRVRAINNNNNNNNSNNNNCGFLYSAHVCHPVRLLAL